MSIAPDDSLVLATRESFFSKNTQLTAGFIFLLF